MANVFFKKGTQSKFNGLTSWDAGSFYLTTDTHRLYASLDGTKAFQVNPGITTVANISALPSSNTISASDYGQFYYCTAENVLAIFNGSDWVQINSYQDTVVDARTVTATEASNIVSVTDVLYQSNTTKGGAQISAEYEFSGANGLTASVTPKYEQATAFHTGVQYYKYNTSTSKYETTSEVTASTVNFSQYYVQGGYSLVLTAPTYTLTPSFNSADGVKESITATLSGGGNSSTMVLKSGSNVTFTEGTGTDAGKYIISASDSTTLASVTGSNNSTSGFDITVKMSDNSSETGNIDPVIKLDSSVTESATGYRFADGVVKLPVYSKSEVDNKIKEFNAMEYKGTASVAADITSYTGGVKNGWVFMASDSFTISGQSAKAGDLIVVQGAEGTSGYVTTPTYTVVPSGNDFDTQYTFENITHGIGVKSNESGTPYVGGFELDVASDDRISLTDSTNDTTGGRKVTIAHKLYNGTTTAAAAGNQPEAMAAKDTAYDITVPTVAFDAAGHVTGITTKTYKVTDTHNNISSVANTVSVTNNVASIGTTVTMADNDSENDAFTITSSNLSISSSNKQLTMNLEWGDF